MGEFTDELEPPPSARPHLAGVLLGLLSGVAMVIILPPQTTPLTLGIGLAVGVIATVVAHELGHVLAGVAGGLRLAEVAVGPVAYVPGRGMRLHRQRALGRATLWPPSGLAAERLRKRYRLMVLGGPLLGLVSAAAMGWASMAPVGVDVRSVLGCGFVAGMAVNVMSLIPMRVRGMMSDGSRLLRLRPGTATARVDACQLSLAGLMPFQRPRDWPQELLADVLDGADTPETLAVALQLAAAADGDRGDLDAAEARLRDARALPLTPEARGVVDASLACVAARNGDAAGARALLNRIPPRAFAGDAQIHQIHAEVLIAEGRIEEARERIGRARETPRGGRVRWPWELEMLDELERHACGGAADAPASPREAAAPPG